MVAAVDYFAAVRLFPRSVRPRRTAWIVVGVAIARLLLIEAPVAVDRFFWPSLVFVPAILLLLADLRRWLTIEFRRGAENGETPCPLRLP